MCPPRTVKATQSHSTREISGLSSVQDVHYEVRESFKGGLSFSETGNIIKAEVGRNTINWQRPGSDHQLMSATFEAIEAGDEIIIRMSGETIYRTSIASPCYDEKFRRVLSAWLTAKIRMVITDPDALPPEAGIFGEQQPLAHFTDAAEHARRTGRNILAFVYDPAQKERGRLQHSLGYFLQNRKTRKTINASFVVALVQLLQISAVSGVLEGQSMETSRWIIFSVDLKPLEQAVIYANPQEGERIALELELAQRFGPS